MARRMEARDDDELALDDKLDVARTMLALKRRAELRRDKNRVEAAIKQSHREEVNRGEVSSVAIPTADDIIGLYASKAKAALNEGAESDTAGRDNTSDQAGA